MSRNSGHQQTPHASLPEVERPSFNVWQPLVAESILWEGQVFIVGGVSDMPALMAVTSQRIALIANGQIMLDFPREWLRPKPRLAAENGVRIFINPDGAGEEAHPVLLRAREGRGAAAEMVGVLTGRPMPLVQASQGIRIPNWKETVGAARAVALPQISDTPEEAPSRPRPSWPPEETAAVAPMPVPARREHAASRPMQTIADRHRSMPDPSPVPSTVSRAARKQGTTADGITVRDDSPAQEAPVTTEPRSRGGTAVWLLSAAIAVLILGGIGVTLQDRYNVTLDDVREQIPTNVQETLGIADDHDDSIALNTAPETVGEQEPTERPVTGGSDNQIAGRQKDAGEPGDDPAAMATDEPTAEPTLPSSDVDDEPLDPTTGVGGSTTALPATEDDSESVQAQAQTVETVVPEEDPTVEPTAEPTAEPTIEPTAVPTQEPTAEPTIEPTPVPTEAPTVAPTAEPTAEPTPEPTAEPTVAPTEEPTVEATEEPTTEPTQEPVESPEATETPTIEPQAPSVQPEMTPEQAVVADGFRYTIEGASVGATVPELPQLNSVAGYGQWVILNVHGQNMADEAQVFDMSSFVLYADGQEVLLDSGTGWVNGLMGNTPAYGATDAILWAPGESHTFTLTFLAPADASSLVLQAGNQMIDLSPAIESAEPLLADEATPAAREMMEGTVVEVIDGETIVVEIDGVRQSVRYLGLDVPTGDACYAAEATEANRSLVAGETVLIERQSTDVDARGNWVRDVWITGQDGGPVLVSQQLIAEGAAEASISVPNTRFAGWLEQTEDQAREDGDGLWSACT